MKKMGLGVIIFLITFLLTGCAVTKDSKIEIKHVARLNNYDFYNGRYAVVFQYHENPDDFDIVDITVNGNVVENEIIRLSKDDFVIYFVDGQLDELSFTSATYYYNGENHRIHYESEKWSLGYFPWATGALKTTLHYDTGLIQKHHHGVTRSAYSNDLVDDVHRKVYYLKTDGFVGLEKDVIAIELSYLDDSDSNLSHIVVTNALTGDNFGEVVVHDFMIENEIIDFSINLSDFENYNAVYDTDSFSFGLYIDLYFDDDTYYRITPVYVLMNNSNFDTSKQSVEINSVDDFINIGNDLSGYYILNTDIDLDGVDFNGFGDFKGVLDGKGYTIKNLSLTAESKLNAGLFSSITSEGAVHDVNFENSFINVNKGMRNSNIGILAGESFGYISCIRLNDIVMSGSDKYDGTVGGVIGNQKGGNIVDIEINKLDINIEGMGTTAVGGVAGISNTILSADVDGDIVVDYSSSLFQNSIDVGGIVGRGDKLSHLWFDGVIRTFGTFNNTGGIAGEIIGEIDSYNDIYNVHATAEIHASSTIVTNIGGITGKMNRSITEFSMVGEIYVQEALFAAVGGIVGRGNGDLTQGISDVKIHAGNVQTGYLGNLQGSIKDNGIHTSVFIVDNEMEKYTELSSTIFSNYVDDSDPTRMKEFFNFVVTKNDGMQTGYYLQGGYYIIENENFDLILFQNILGFNSWDYSEYENVGYPHARKIDFKND